MIPIIFQLGPFPLNSFGLMMVCAFYVAWKRLWLSLEEEGEDPLIAEPMIVLAAVAGIVGSRVNYILTNLSEFRAHPMELIFSGAGFVFYGGFFSAMAALLIFLRVKKKSFIRFADITAPSLALGYAVGRIGCHLSGDGDYGHATDSPFGFSYVLGIAPTPPGLLVHPTPIYETVGALLIAWLLLELRKRHLLKGNGQIFGLYLLLSAGARYLVEILRIEPLTRYGITEAQCAAIVIAILGTALLIGTADRKRPSPQPT